jgi:hypothetical protein
MGLSFRKIGIDIEDCFYRGRDAGDFLWVTVRVTLSDGDMDTHGELKIPVAMSLDGKRPLDQLRDEALAAALQALKAAASALEGQSYADLVAAHVAMDRGVSD